MTALQHLCKLADQHKAGRSPNFPTKYVPKSKYTDRSANDLTRCVVDFLNFSGYFGTRLQSTGQYRDDLKRFVRSQQRAGLPDVFGIVDGKAVFVEVKYGRDRLSDEQKQTIAELEKAGACVFVASSFEEFLTWFSSRIETPLASTL